MSTKKVSLSIQARVDVRALALCCRFYSEKGVFIDRKGTLLSWIVDDLCALIRRTKGWSYESTQEAVERLKTYGLLGVEKSISNKRDYLSEIDTGNNLSTDIPLPEVSAEDVEAVLKRIEEQKTMK